MPKGVLEGSGPLARLRVLAGLTQAAAAAKLGISPQHLQRLEAGHHDPRAALITSMAKAYRVTIEVVMRAVESARRAAAA